jgi:hypothetical protein
MLADLQMPAGLGQQAEMKRKNNVVAADLQT